MFEGNQSHCSVVNNDETLKNYKNMHYMVVSITKIEKVLNNEKEMSRKLWKDEYTVIILLIIERLIKAQDLKKLTKLEICAILYDRYHSFYKKETMVN